jgi:hydroxymethylglutaryl-CoA reductase
MTLLEVRKRSDETVYLHASVTMMSLEVAAIGGGTNLEPQKSILNSMLGKCDDLAPGEKGI